MNLNELQDVIDFIQKYTEREFNWAVTIFSVAVIVTIFFIAEYSRSRSKNLNFNTQHMVSGAGISSASFMLLNLIFGDLLFLFTIPAASLIGMFVRKKYLSFIEDDTQKAEKPKDKNAEKKVNSQHSYVKQIIKSRKARPVQVMSVMDVLLDYGYISTSQKETVEINGLFLTPDEMAKQLLTTPILTIEQLREATAIMNIIRREGRMLSREEALGILMQISEGKKAQDIQIQAADESAKKVQVSGTPPDTSSYEWHQRNMAVSGGSTQEPPSGNVTGGNQ